MTNKPNIVLITIDSLRADRCGFLNGTNNLTPAMDRLADDGLVFENAIAPGPRTPDSMPTIFTGYNAFDRGGPVANFDDQKQLISRHLQSSQTLPEALSEAGYETGGFTPNPYTSRYFRFDIGFDYFRDFLDELSRRFSKRFQSLPRGPFDAIRLLLTWLRGENVSRAWESYYEEIIDWVRNAREPYFLWVFLMDTHNPYLTTSRFRTQPYWKMWYGNLKWYFKNNDSEYSSRDHGALVRAYEDAIKYADSFINQLTRDLSDDDPVYVIHSDHGEGFGEHGIYGHLPYAMYEENLHVPLLVANTGWTGRRADPVPLTAIAPTLLELANASGSFPCDSLGDNHSWNWVTAKGSVAGKRRVAYRVGPYKFITGPGYEGELYNLDSDPDERTNLVIERPEVRDIFADIISHEQGVNAEKQAVWNAVERIKSSRI